MRVSEIRVNQIRVNQGLGVLTLVSSPKRHLPKHLELCIMNFKLVERFVYDFPPKLCNKSVSLKALN